MVNTFIKLLNYGYKYNVESTGEIKGGIGKASEKQLKNWNFKFPLKKVSFLFGTYQSKD
jgi:hypothetical protein